MLSQSSASTSRARSQHFRPQSRPLLEQYPKKQGKRDRSFQSTWYDAFSWLEYFENVDACFCYPCQMFSKGSTKEKTFVETGFSNWKTAMESGKGLKKHEQSEVHIRAMASWKEKEFREKWPNGTKSHPSKARIQDLAKNRIQHYKIFSC